MALPFIRTLQNAMFQQDNARLHVADIVQIFFDTENIRLLPWATRSSDLSALENIWSIIVEQLYRHHTSVTTIEAICHLIEAAWAAIPVHSIQSLYDSISRRITAVGGDCSRY